MTCFDCRLGEGAEGEAAAPATSLKDTVTNLTGGEGDMASKLTNIGANVAGKAGNIGNMLGKGVGGIGGIASKFPGASSWF